MTEWITTADAADISKYHPEHIRRLVREGRIDARKFGPVWQVSLKSLNSYLMSVEEKGGKRGPKKGG
jgi:hypothetical protein